MFLLTACRSYAPVSREPYMRSDSAFAQFVQKEQIPFSRHNDAKLLNGGHAKFEALFNDIRVAKHHVHLEYFNFRNDSITNALIDLLAEKVKDGVEVRAMFDAFGNSSNNRPLKNRHLKAIREKGIDIVEFDPLSFPYINHVFSRDHRKIVVIDGLIAYTGGINVADYYLNGLPEIGEWHDMHVRITGEAVAEFQRIFLQMWNCETGDAIDGAAYFPVLPDSMSNHTEWIAVTDRCPNKTPERIRDVYAKSIDAAKEKIQIINPYFIPTHKVRSALYKALADSVEVEIMIPSKSDIPFTPDAAWYVANKLRKRGAKIYLYDGGFHHSKVMAVDSLFCTIGSANLNSRSLRYDYEVNAFFIDGDITQDITTIFENDKEKSRLLTKDIWKEVSLWKKFCGWLGNLLSSFM